jgi:hypothetical protein
MVTAQILKVATEGKDGTQLLTRYQHRTKCPSAYVPIKPT